MKHDIILGAALGFIAGAFIANNCCGVRNLVDDTQRKVMSKLKSKGETIINNMDKTECASDFSNCCSCQCECEEDQSDEE